MPSDELPLDIPYEKLADWLVRRQCIADSAVYSDCDVHDLKHSLCYPQTSRQKLSKDWHKKLQAIRAKAGEAAKELPTEISLPKGETPGYTTVKSIRDTLAKTADKTFFGSLTGTAGLWDKILRAYEKDSEPLSLPLLARSARGHQLCREAPQVHLPRCKADACCSADALKWLQMCSLGKWARFWSAMLTLRSPF